MILISASAAYFVLLVLNRPQLPQYRGFLPILRQGVISLPLPMEMTAWGEISVHADAEPVTSCAAAPANPDVQVAEKPLPQDSPQL